MKLILLLAIALTAQAADNYLAPFARAMDEYEARERADPAYADVDALLRLSTMHPRWAVAKQQPQVDEKALAALMERAAAATKRYLARDPAHALALSAYVTLMIDLGRPQEAVAYIEKVGPGREKDFLFQHEYVRAATAARNDDALGIAINFFFASAKTQQERATVAIFAEDALRLKEWSRGTQTSLVMRGVEAANTLDPNDATFAQPQLARLLRYKAKLFADDPQKRAEIEREASRLESSAWFAKKRDEIEVASRQNFRVDIVQGGREITSDRSIVLARKPFTIRVHLANEFAAVEVNLSPTGKVQDRLATGIDLRAAGACKPTRFPCWTPGRDEMRNELPVGEESSAELVRTLSASNWTRSTAAGKVTIAEYDVAKLGGKPIEKTTYQRLYLTVVLQNAVVRAEDVREFELVFR